MDEIIQLRDKYLADLDDDELESKIMKSAVLEGLAIYLENVIEINYFRPAYKHYKKGQYSYDYDYVLGGDAKNNLRKVMLKYLEEYQNLSNYINMNNGKDSKVKKAKKVKKIKKGTKIKQSKSNNIKIIKLNIGSKTSDFIKEIEDFIDLENKYIEKVSIYLLASMLCSIGDVNVPKRKLKLHKKNIVDIHAQNSDKNDSIKTLIYQNIFFDLSKGQSVQHMKDVKNSKRRFLNAICTEEYLDEIIAVIGIFKELSKVMPTSSFTLSWILLNKRLEGLLEQVAFAKADCGIIPYDIKFSKLKEKDRKEIRNKINAIALDLSNNVKLCEDLLKDDNNYNFLDKFVEDLFLGSAFLVKIKHEYTKKNYNEKILIPIKDLKKSCRIKTFKKYMRNESKEIFNKVKVHNIPISATFYGEKLTDYEILLHNIDEISKIGSLTKAIEIEENTAILKRSKQTKKLDINDINYIIESLERELKELETRRIAICKEISTYKEIQERNKK